MSSDKIAHFDSVALEAAIKDSVSMPLVVDFWAPWCGPCRGMASLLEQLVDEVGNTVRIAKINIDAHGAVAAEHQVRSIPTLLFFKNGQCTGRLVGLQPKEKILEAIARLPSAASN